MEDTRGSKLLDDLNATFAAAEKGPRAVATCGGQALPGGVEVLQLQDRADSRGVLTEIFRASWRPDIQPVQFNLLRSRPGVLRGVHAHWKHEDYLVPIEGPMWLALKDIRPDSPNCGEICELDLHGDQLVAVKVPPGVAHGFYFASDAMLIYGVSTYWDMADELACAWNDPELGFGWAAVESPPLLSQRDTEAGSLAEMTAEWILRSRTLTADG